MNASFEVTNVYFLEVFDFIIKYKALDAYTKPFIAVISVFLCSSLALLLPLIFWVLNERVVELSVE